MKNCLIMGFARSGTSLMGGILHQAGYYMGNNLYPPRDTNPKGFFECEFINEINERILEHYDYMKINQNLPKTKKQHSPYNPSFGQRWLSLIDHKTSIEGIEKGIENEIRLALAEPIFAYKDPRFNYSLPIWTPFLDKDVIFIVMFRKPEITIQSVLDECIKADYLKDFDINNKMVESIWVNSYLSLLKNVETIGSKRFLFINYQQLLTGEILPMISEVLGVELKNDFIEKELNRTRSEIQIGIETNKIFERLCNLSLIN